MTWHRHRSQNAETLGDTTPNKNLSSSWTLARWRLTGTRIERNLAKNLPWFLVTEKIKKKSRKNQEWKNQEKIKKKSKKNQEKIKKKSRMPNLPHSLISTRSAKKSRKNQVSSRPDQLKNQEKIKFRVDQIGWKIKKKSSFESTRSAEKSRIENRPRELHLTSRRGALTFLTTLMCRKQNGEL